MNDLVSTFEHSSRQINWQIPIRDERFLWPGAMSLSECRSHAAKLFPGAKWLGDIIISAMIKSFDLLLFLISSRQHYDRRRAPLAEPLRQILAIHVGQSEIQNTTSGG